MAGKSDRELADALASAKDNDAMIEAENWILERLDVPLDQSERGLTLAAVASIERFVSEQTGTEWTYNKLGPFVVEGAPGKIGFDEVIVLGSGTEISVEAALGDLQRAAELVADGEGGDGDGAASDLQHVAELVRHLAGVGEPDGR